MKPHQIFAAMSPEQCERIMGQISKDSPDAFQQTVVAAAGALKFRPQYLLKQPMAKRVASVRRALSRIGSQQLAEEILAVYFLKWRLELLTEWLDLVGLEHEEGILQSDVIESPEAGELEKHVAARHPDVNFSAHLAPEWKETHAFVGEPNATVWKRL